MERILKYALLVVRSNKILLQIEKKQDKLLLPGGKPLKDEDHIKCLKREIKEELGVQLDTDSLQLLGKFEDIAADGKSIVSVELFRGELKGKPKPGNEVLELVWFGAKDDKSKLSPVIRNQIMPYLHAMRIIE